MAAISSVVLLLHLFLLCDGWSYQNQDSWPTICQTGKRQSPIALYHDDVRKFRFKPLNFSRGYFQEQELIVTNSASKNTVTITLANASEPLTVRGGNLGAVLIFDAIYFHWTAEHPIDGLSYSLDATFDHYNSKYSSRLEANNYTDGVFTFAVNYNITQEDNPFYAPIVDVVPSIQAPDATTKVKTTVKINDLLPSNKQKYFRYKGSIPVPFPDCYENLLYTIFDTPINLSRGQLEKLTNVTATDNFRLRRVCRDLQDTNAIKVYYTV